MSQKDKTTKMIFFPWEKWNPIPKGVECEATRLHKIRPIIFSIVRDESNLKRIRKAIEDMYDMR